MAACDASKPPTTPTRRLTENDTTDTKHLYYSAGWQVLEERLSSGTTANIQYVWSPVYIDAMVLRDRDANSSNDNVLGERLWVAQDANFNVTALIDNSGNVVETFTYDAFGLATVRNASFVVKSGGSDYAWIYRHQGGRWSSSSGLVSFRFREYSPTLGRWVSLDPRGFLAGTKNLYSSFHDSPINFNDSFGLTPQRSIGGINSILDIVMENHSELNEELVVLLDRHANLISRLNELRDCLLDALRAAGGGRVPELDYLAQLFIDCNNIDSNILQMVQRTRGLLNAHRPPLGGDDDFVWQSNPHQAAMSRSTAIQPTLYLQELTTHNTFGSNSNSIINAPDSLIDYIRIIGLLSGIRSAIDDLEFAISEFERYYTCQLGVCGHTS